MTSAALSPKQLGTCRSCQAPVLWVRSVKGGTMPIDREQLPGAPGVRLFWIGEDGIARLGPAGAPGHPSHFVSCPDRNKWRKQKTGTK